MFDLDVQLQDSCRVRSIWAQNLWEIGDPRNSNSAVNRRSVNVYIYIYIWIVKQQAWCVEEDDSMIGEVGERELVLVVSVRCDQERDMTRG